MNVLIAPDSFKGSLSAFHAAEAMKLGALSVDNNVKCVTAPLSDGGEGMIDAIRDSAGAKIINTRIKNPLGEEIDSFYAISKDGKTGFIEMAAASGLCLIEEKDRNPMYTSTYGTGQLIREALLSDCEIIYIGAGGSGTNDGGMGMAAAMGYRFLDENNNELPAIGKSLINVKKIDSSGAIKTNAEIIVMCDVTNPFYGENGAARIYAAQKGASADEICILDKGMKNFSQIIKNDLGVDIGVIKGTGSAGGFSGGVLAFLNGELIGGFDCVSRIINLKEKIINSDLILTGEGKTDAQTAMGKVICGLGNLAKKHNKPVVCLSGSVDYEEKLVYAQGITAMFSIINKPVTLEYAMENASALIQSATENIIKLCMTKI